LDLPADAVRIEVAAALRRDIPVIPVLVQGARMPAPEALPADLADLAYRNAVELTHPRWSSDVELLIEALEGDLGTSPGTKPAPTAPEARGSDAKGAGAADLPRPATPHAGEAPSLPPRQPPAADVSPRPVPAARSRAPLVGGLLAALALIGGGGGYFWYERNQALEAAAKQAAAEKAEAERIAARKAQEEEAAKAEAAKAEAAKAEAARLAAEKASADAAALEKARQEAAEAKAEAERLAADVKRQQAAAAAAAKAQLAAAQATADARAREAAAEARAREAAAAEARARDAAAAEARARQAAEAQRQPPKPPAGPPPTPLTVWLPLKDFVNLRQSQPRGQDFPYAFQANCVPNEPFRVRGRFGSYPSGVNRFAYNVVSAERYQEWSSSRSSQGYKLYSRQSVSCPVPGGDNKTLWVAAVWVQ